MKEERIRDEGRMKRISRWNAGERREESRER